MPCPSLPRTCAMNTTGAAGWCSAALTSLRTTAWTQALKPRYTALRNSTTPSPVVRSSTPSTSAALRIASCSSRT
eukprot:3061205-Pyramimonas_sp.AAC.1